MHEIRKVRRQASRTGLSSSAVRVRRVRPNTVPEHAAPTLPYDKRTRYFIDWELPPEKLFNLYMMTSFLYYHLNRSLIRDSDYDKLCHLLDRTWSTWKHPHKRYVDRGQLIAGTGYAIEYPTIVKQAATMMLELHLEY